MSDDVILLMFCGMLVFMTGIYLLFGFRNLIRIMLGVEVLSKGVTLILLSAGQQCQNIATTQSMLISFIIVETILAAVMLAIVVMVHRIYSSLDIKLLSKLRG